MIDNATSSDIAAEQFSICQPSAYQLPNKVLGFDEFSVIVPFFLYQAAPLRDCTLSLDFEGHLTSDEKTDLYEKMLGERMGSFLAVTSVSAKDTIKAIAQLSLADQNMKINCEKGVFRKKRNDAEGSYANAFDELLRHLRNSIAHSRIRKEGEFVLLEDYVSPWSEDKNKKKSLTARIILKPSTLLSWADLMKQTASRWQG